ncbi:DUF480 domain-containing protein [Massilia sp. B-10]|nr:DUF480 domain-containing protein [Massilia sp. B-10]
MTKYEHRMRVKWSLGAGQAGRADHPDAARPANVSHEIRTRSGRLHEFKTVADVEACLQFLIDKYPPIVARLALAPGTKEPRYMASCSAATPRWRSRNPRSAPPRRRHRAAG